MQYYFFKTETVLFTYAFKKVKFSKKNERFYALEWFVSKKKILPVVNGGQGFQ